MKSLFFKINNILDNLNRSTINKFIFTLFYFLAFLLLISGLFPSGFYFYEVRIVLDAFYLKSRNIIYKFAKLNYYSVILLVFIVYYLITLN